VADHHLIDEIDRIDREIISLVSARRQLDHHRGQSRLRNGEPALQTTWEAAPHDAILPRWEGLVPPSQQSSSNWAGCTRVAAVTRLCEPGRRS
jgi:hypothetical protein